MEIKNNKLFRVVKDLQGGDFAMGSDLTIEQWREQAIEWAGTDGHYGLVEELKKLPQNEVLDEIAEFWQIEFAELKYGIVILCYDTNDISYIDNITKLFNTREEAEKEMQIAMAYELESLGDNFTIDDNEILYKEDNIIVSEYSIKEFEICQD